MNLPWITDAARAPRAGRRRRDHRRAVRRRGQPPAGRALRAAGDPRGAVHVGLDQLPPARRRAVRDPDRSSTPATRTSSRPGSSGPTRSSTARSTRSPRPARSRSSSAATTRSRGRPRRPSPRSAGRAAIGIVHFDAHADTANDDWGVLAGHGTPMRRLIESGAVDGRNFVQVGLRGYWPPVDVVRVDAGARPALPLHDRDRGARRGRRRSTTRSPRRSTGPTRST